MTSNQTVIYISIQGFFNVYGLLLYFSWFDTTIELAICEFVNVPGEKYLHEQEGYMDSCHTACELISLEKIFISHLFALNYY